MLKVDIGDKTIQLVAGLRPYYSIQQLEGKLIVVITNLEPKSLRGIFSEGMLLAAQSGDKVVVLTPEEGIPTGSIVK